MRSTVLHRPHTEEETMGLIAETLEALVDARGDGIIYGALHQWGWEPLPEGGQSKYDAKYDANTLRSALRHLLPCDGFGEPRFRIDYGWTTDEIAKVIVLLRMLAESMRGAAAYALKMPFNPPGSLMLAGTAQTLMRDADKIDRLVERWSIGVVLPGGKALQPEVTHRIKLNGDPLGLGKPAVSRRERESQDGGE